jgi:hypothetical protein
VKILHYKNDQEFVIGLKLKQENEELILVKTNNASLKAHEIAQFTGSLNAASVMSMDNKD